MTKPANPGKRLKPFFWTKVGNQATGPSIWDEVVSLDPAVSFDIKELEDAFSLDTTVSKISTSQSEISSKSSSTVALLDSRRAMHVMIMLSRIKLPPTEIKRSLLSLDDSKLSVDELKVIARHLPTPDEVKRINEFENDKQLGKAEQYFKEIISIPRLSERIACMLYRRRLELDIEETRPELDIVRHAMKELKASSRFRQVLKTVLSIGNALNGSSYRGNARGFQLDALLKMRETTTSKASPDCPTLLHFVAKVLLKSDAELVNFLDELPHLEAAARISIQTVSSTVATLSAGLAQVQSEIKTLRQGKLKGSPEDRFVQVMEPFAAQNMSSIQALENMNKAVEHELQGLLKYFGETGASESEGTKVEDFFSLIVSFSTSLRKAALEMHEKMTKTTEASTPTPSRLGGKPIIPSPTRHLSKYNKNAPSASGVSPQAKAIPARSPALLVPPPPPPPVESSDIRHRSVGRGELDETIKSMRKGIRRDRDRERGAAVRPLSKMFLDGN